MAHKVEDKNRRDVTLVQSRTGEVVPSYFETDNPTLLTFLDKYYDFLDSDGQNSFSTSIREVVAARDTQQTSTKLLDEVVKEIGDGLQSSAFFEQPRLMAKLLGGFYRVKGTLVSAEGFFRGFFGQEVSIEYPKDQLFIVGESEVGFESQKFIQNNTIFQIFSILIKTGISTTEYESLYKKFVHPAGWHFQGEVVSTNQLTIGIGQLASGDSIRPDPIDISTKVFGPETFLTLGTGFNDLTVLLDSNGQNVRATLASLISSYQNLTSSQLSKFYGNFIELIDPNSFTFDNRKRGRALDLGDSGSLLLFDLDSDVIGTINGWNNDTQFAGYGAAKGATPMPGLPEIDDSATTIAITYSSATPYNRVIQRKGKVNLTGVSDLSYWVNAGGSGDIWGNDPNGTLESLKLQWAHDSSFSTAYNIISTDPTAVTSGEWTLQTGNIVDFADSSVHIRIFQEGTQTPPDKDNWAFTSVYMNYGYDSSGPDMSMALETMDNDMFKRYTSDSAY